MSFEINDEEVLLRDEFLRRISGHLTSRLGSRGNLVKILVDYDWPLTLHGNAHCLEKTIEETVLSVSENVYNSIIKIGCLVRRNNDDSIEMEFRISAPVDDTSYFTRMTTDIHLKRVKKLLTGFGTSVLTELQGKKVQHRYIITFEKKKDEYHLSRQEDKFIGKTALIVEDNSINALVFTNFLEEWGIQTFTAKNGREAIEFVNSKNFDIILMDIHMPELNGIEATRIISGIKRKGIVIGITASNLKKEQDEIKAAGAVDCLIKPVSSETLLRCIRKQMTKLNPSI